MTHRYLVWALPALMIQFIGAGLYFVVFDKGVAAGVVYTIVKIVMVALPLVLVWHGLKVPKFFGEDRRMRSIALGTVVGLAMASAIVWTYFTFEGFFVSHFADDVRLKVEGFGLIPYYLPFALFLSTVHSLFEEYYWRWFVFGGLRSSCSFRWSATIAAIGFSLHHFILLSGYVSWPLTIAFGIIIGATGFFWSWLFEKQKGVLAPWISHAFADAAIMWVGWLLISST